MPFDANNVFHDGTTITGSITPTSTTKSDGSAVLDLKETGAKGLAAVLIMGADIAGATDTLQVSIETSDTEGSGYGEVARFPLLTKGTGMPGTYIIRFSSDKRYARAKIVATDVGGGGFSVASTHILLANHPFHVL